MLILRANLTFYSSRQIYLILLNSLVDIVLGDIPSTSTDESSGRLGQSLSQTHLKIIEKQSIALLNWVVPVVSQEADTPATAMVGTAMSKGNYVDVNM